MSNQIINHEDIFQTLDDLRFSKRKRGPVGWVQAYITDKNNKVTEVCNKPNLIVAQGKEFVAQKVFGIYEADDGTLRPNYLNYEVTHFAVGGGGATAQGDVIDFHGPHIADNGLYRPINLGDELYLEEPRRLDENEIFNYRNAVKPINIHGQVKLEEQEYEGTTAFSRVLCTCVVPPGEPSALIEGQSVQISESGLYFVDQNVANQRLPNAVKLFAHCCLINIEQLI